MTALDRVALLAVVAAVAACSDSTHGRVVHADPLERLQAGGRTPARLRIGVSPGTGMETTTERAAPLRDYLGETLDVPVELVPSRSYDELLGLLEREQIDAAVLSPLTYVRARRRLPIVPIAVASSDGSPTYGGYVIVPSDSRVHSLDGLRGKAMAWVDSTSTSGYLYPRAMMRWRGYDPDRFFGRVVFAGDHWSAIRMVALHEVDAAAVASSFVDPGRSQRIAEADEVRVIAKTSRIPFDCVVVEASMPRAFARRLREALLSLVSHPDVSSHLATSWGFSAFVPASDDRYDAVALVHQQERLRSDPR